MRQPVVVAAGEIVAHAVRQVIDQIGDFDVEVVRSAADVKEALRRNPLAVIADVEIPAANRVLSMFAYLKEAPILVALADHPNLISQWVPTAVVIRSDDAASLRMVLEEVSSHSKQG